MAYSAAILARAKARLAAAREQNAQDDAARIGAIYERLPRLRQIDLELQKTAAKVCAAAFRAGEDPGETIRQLKDENLRLRDHDPEELCFYSKATTDFEFLFPFGWGELWGVADRTDYDLTQHQKTSGKDLTYFDPETNERYIPYVVEPSLGVERSVLAVLCDAYDEEVVDEAKNDVRVVMHLHPTLAPYKAAILPLSKKLSDKAREIYAELSKDWMIDFDETGSIGKRYRREDEIGTPFCITVDFDTVGDAEKAGDNCVTIRERDTMAQVRVPISELKSYLAEKLAY